MTPQRPMPLGNFKNNSETLPELMQTNFSKKKKNSSSKCKYLKNIFETFRIV